MKTTTIDHFLNLLIRIFQFFSTTSFCYTKKYEQVSATKNGARIGGCNNDWNIYASNFIHKGIKINYFTDNRERYRCHNKASTKLIKLDKTQV